MPDRRSLRKRIEGTVISFMIKEIAVIGAGGKMGSWFTKYFSKENYTRLLLYDINPHFQCALKKSTICHTLGDCVADADIVFLCVPIKDVPLTIRQCAIKMKTGAILAEISSVKHQSFRAFKKIRSKVRPLCIHPMFGPGAEDTKDMNIILIPVQDEKKETSICKCIFQDALITVLPTPKVHDELIAIVLGLTHYINLIFGSLLSKENFDLLKKVSGTTFGLQSLLCRSIFSDSPDLIIALLSQNPSCRRYIQNYINNANELAELIFQGNEIKLKAHLQKTQSILESQQTLEVSYQRMYHIVKELNRNRGLF